MSLRIKRAARAVFFLLMVVFVIGWIQNVVTPKFDWPVHNRRSYKSIRSAFIEPKNSLDAIYLGTSQTFCSISPMDIYNASHIRSYNLASIGQRVPVAYYMLRGILRRQSPKLVVIDASGFFYTEEELMVTGRWEEMVDSLPMSCYREKLDMMREIATLQGRQDDKEYLFSALLPLLRYHSDYMVEEDNFQRQYLNQPYQRKGHVATYNFIAVKKKEMRTARAMLDVNDTYASDDDNRAALEECIAANEPYLEMMRDLCREHGAELAFMKVPVCASNIRARGYWSANKHELAQAMADRLGVKFLDMCYEDLGLDWQYDAFDGGVHVNYRGARKITAKLLDWMQGEFGLSSEANPKLDAQWDHQSEIWASEVEYLELELEHDLIGFLDRVQKGDYTLFTTVSGGTGKYWSDEAQRKLEETTGTTLDLRDVDNAAYIGISSKGAIIEEKHDKESCNTEGKLADGLQYKASSDSQSGKVDIWGTDYAPAEPGIHFVVYDNNLCCVVDAVCFDTTTESLKAVQETRYQYVMRQKLIEYVHKRM